MIGVLSIISALLPIFLTTAKSAGLPPDTANLITGIEQAAAEFIQLFHSGAGNTVTASSILAALQASLAVLQHQNIVDPRLMAIINALAQALNAGIVANQNIHEVDPTKLQPITPLT